VKSPRIVQRTAERLNTRLWAAYAELRVPLIAETMGIPLFHTLDLSLKARYDRYDSHGPIGTVDNIPYADGGTLIRGKSTFDRLSPDVGLAWTPIGGLLVRGSVSSNFTPPPFTALYDVVAGQTNFEKYIFSDPLAPADDPYYTWNGPIPAQTQANPTLRPSVARSYNLGLVITPPRAMHNLNLEVNYYRTRIRDRISDSTELFDLIPATEYFAIPEFFVRDASGYIVRQIIKPINIGWDKSESLDVQFSYAIPTGIGLITPSILYSRNFKQQVSYAGRVSTINNLGTSTGIDKYRIVGNLDFTRPDLMARLTVRYIPPYENTYDLTREDGEFWDSDFDGVKDQPMHIASLTTYDFTTRWQATPKLTLSAGGRNIFNAKPPFAMIDRRPFDASRYDIRGRVLYAEARVNL
jgi:iron complex outermembrane receptor protein